MNCLLADSRFHYFHCKNCIDLFHNFLQLPKVVFFETDAVCFASCVQMILHDPVGVCSGESGSNSKVNEWFRLHRIRAMQVWKLRMRTIMIILALSSDTATTHSGLWKSGMAKKPRNLCYTNQMWFLKCKKEEMRSSSLTVSGTLCLSISGTMHSGFERE